MAGSYECVIMGKSKRSNRANYVSWVALRLEWIYHSKIYSEPSVKFSQTHIRVCLKSCTTTLPSVVPMHMSPFAAITVGIPSIGAPSTLDTFCEALEYIVCVIP